MVEQTDRSLPPHRDGGDVRQGWVKPALRRLSAGSAEAGSNPVNPEGQLDGS